MRLSLSLVLALSAAVTAEQAQQPLLDRVKAGLGWVGKQTEKVTERVASYVPSAVPSPKNPINVGAAKVSEYVADKLNATNWKQTLEPSPSEKWREEPQEWMVFLTGGNKTCRGLCGNLTNEWNKAVTLLAPLPSRPKLAYADCDKAPLMCASWNANPPYIWHFLVPHALPDQSTPATDIRRIRLNTVNTTATDIVKIHTEKEYTNHPVYEGAFHPFDGWMHQYDLAIYYAYVTTGISSLPSWAPMILISFASRAFIGRRARQRAIPAQSGSSAPAAPAQ